jgi:hypothetical protein
LLRKHESFGECHRHTGIIANARLGWRASAILGSMLD